MTLLIILLVVAPISNFVVVLSKKSIDTYNLIQDRFTNGDLIEQVEAKFRQLENYLSFVNPESFKDVVLNYSSQLNSFLISSTAGFIRGTTQFVTNLFLIILTLFFFFRDGERLVKRLMQLTPLSNKYDRQIFKDFHNISYSTIVSSFVTAIAQGIVGGLGFYLVGIPAFFLGVAMAFASLIPVGSAIIWLPTALILMAIGKAGSGLFIIIWGVLVVGLIDNVLRPVLIRGKVKIHPLFLFFSIIGGVAAWGFWGLIFGPIVLAIALTFIHIYEMEYEEILEK